MARRKSRSADTSDIANELDSLLLDAATMPALHPMSPFTDLDAVEDNRTYHPEGPNRAPLSIHHYTEFEVPNERIRQTPRPNIARPYSGATQNIGSLSPQIAFRSPNRVAVCIRRKQRKEVLHALRKAGRGGSRPRRYNRNSQVRC